MITELHPDRLETPSGEVEIGGQVLLSAVLGRHRVDERPVRASGIGRVVEVGCI